MGGRTSSAMSSRLGASGLSGASCAFGAGTSAGCCAAVSVFYGRLL